MGCCYSRIEREEMVARCKARKRYMKQLVRARQSLSASHSMYLRSLHSTGSALVQFSNAETALHLKHHQPQHCHHRPPPPPSRVMPETPMSSVRPPPPPPPMSSSSETWTTTTTTTSAAASPLPPPPPPPPPAAPSWDFWDPFGAPPPQATTEEEWETTTASEAAVDVNAAPSVVSGYSKEENSGSELAMVVSRNSKDLSEIFRELDEYFLKAADAGCEVSSILEVSGSSLSTHPPTGKVQYYQRSLSPLSWTCNSYSKLNAFSKCGDEVVGFDASGGSVLGISASHSGTLERLHAWEKKLLAEVKTAEMTKVEHEKKVTLLRKLEMKRAEYVKTAKTKKDVESLESRLMVAAQAIESTSSEIVKLRETELYPQLIELVKRFMSMWRSMYQCHQVQTHIVKQLKYLSTIPSAEPTSEIHRQSTLQLELEVQQWHLSFCNVVKAQRDYIQSLTGWLRLSLFQFNRNPLAKTTQDSKIYSLCEEWHLAVDRMPDKVASDGIKSLLTVIHSIVVQQGEEQKQKKRSESAFKELEKKSSALRTLESKYGQFSMPEMSGNKSQVKISEKRAKVEMLRVKAEDEKAKHEKSVSVTRAVTLNNLQMGFPNVFEAMTGFTSVCMHAFESVYNQAKSAGEEHNMKMLLP
uniref:Uncharacterized protein n=1 Tax=Kalanchoe fedtschenkoi TaxID=63787 RepID=A0A7N0UCY8_KALFE